VAASRSVGQPETLGETIRKRQEDGAKSCAHNHIELKQAGVRLMTRVRADGNLVTVLKGLPLNSQGLKKQQHELIAKTPCTLMYSFSFFTESILSPAKTLARRELDTEAKEIVRAMIRLRSKYFEAYNASRKTKKQGGGSRKNKG